MRWPRPATPEGTAKIPVPIIPPTTKAVVATKPGPAIESLLKTVSPPESA